MALKEARIAWGFEIGMWLKDAKAQARAEGFNYMLFNGRVLQLAEPEGEIGTIREAYLRHPDIVGVE